MTGVEGYIESAASGIVAGTNAARLALGLEPVVFPTDTMMGAMAHYITHTSASNFQPMNANFGIMPNSNSAFGISVSVIRRFLNGPWLT